LVAVLVCGFSGLASRLGPGSLLVRAGLVAYVLGASAGVAAALVNGFVVPGLAARYQDRPADQLESLRPLLALCHEVNQTCSRVDVLAASAAIVLWSVRLGRRPGRSLPLAVLGGVAGGVPAVALLSGNVPMDVHGFGGFVLAQTV